MKATHFEFRFRLAIFVAILWLGFAAPWIDYLHIGSRIGLIEWLALGLSRTGLVTFTVATPIVIVFGAFVAALGAALRIWGTAYLGAFTVFHSEMQAGAVMAGGPYRFVRNPLYIGTWFMIAAMCFLMTPSGALFVLTLSALFELRLIFAEEAHLTAQLGQPYRDYLSSVPRLFPRLRTRPSTSPAHPNWLRSVLAELNAIGVFLTLAVVSWTYNHSLMVRAILISLGVSLIVRALLPDTNTQLV